MIPLVRQSVPRFGGLITLQRRLIPDLASSIPFLSGVVNRLTRGFVVVAQRCLAVSIGEGAITGSAGAVDGRTVAITIWSVSGPLVRDRGARSSFFGFLIIFLGLNVPLAGSHQMQVLG